MKEIIKYIKDHLKSDFNPITYIYTAVFLTITIFLNYYFNFEKKILDDYYSKNIGYLYFFLFYAFAYYMISIPKQIIEKNTSPLKNPMYWIKTIFFLGLIGIAGAFYHFNYFTTFFNDGTEIYYLLKIINNSKRLFLYIIPLFIFQYYFNKDIKGLYGLGAGKFNIKPYFTMLLIMFPLIAIASFGPDFQKTYPTLKPWFLNEVWGLNKFTMAFLYEIIYGVDFITVELVFRGSLVIGMVSILGKDAILPMVSTYAFLHFGKPLGETLGSIFGGYILGVIALYSRNILGGCIIHIGVAYLMEITAYIQHYFIQPNN